MYAWRNFVDQNSLFRDKVWRRADQSTLHAESRPTGWSRETETYLTEIRFSEFGQRCFVDRGFSVRRRSRSSLCRCFYIRGIPLFNPADGQRSRNRGCTAFSCRGRREAETARNSKETEMRGREDGQREGEKREERKRESLASRAAPARERELLSSFDVWHRYPAKRKSNVPRVLSRTISTRHSRKL